MIYIDLYFFFFKVIGFDSLFQCMCSKWCSLFLLLVLSVVFLTFKPYSLFFCICFRMRYQKFCWIAQQAHWMNLGEQSGSQSIKQLFKSIFCKHPTYSCLYLLICVTLCFQLIETVTLYLHFSQSHLFHMDFNILLCCVFHCTFI